MRRHAIYGDWLGLPQGPFHLPIFQEVAQSSVGGYHARIVVQEQVVRLFLSHGPHCHNPIELPGDLVDRLREEDGQRLAG